MNDSFTLAVVIGMVVVLVVFLTLILVDKGSPADKTKSPE